MGRPRISTGLATALCLALAGCFNPSGKDSANTEGTSTGSGASSGSSSSTESPTATSPEPVTTSPEPVTTTEVEPTSSTTAQPETSTSSGSETTLPSEGMCSDGHLDPGEECDDGNFRPGDGCEPDCAGARSLCGDGLLDAGEECDDGGAVGGDGCSSGCMVEQHYVFVTSERFSGDLQGLEGADAQCNKLASAHFGPERKFVAWLSGPAPVTERLVGGPFIYVTPMGGTVASSFDDLIDGQLQAPIDRDEAGNSLSEAEPICDEMQGVWTGTDPNGSPSLLDCDDWTTTVGKAQAGLLSKADVEWSDACDASCEMMLRLYCVETLK